VIAPGLRFLQLSQARQALIRYCQAINHGSIEDLKVVSGEPVFDGSPVMVKDVKLDTDAGSRPELAISDFALSDAVVRLMKQLDEVHAGTIRRIEVRGGIPRRIIVATHFSDES
jgi:hypothetical protein